MSSQSSNMLYAIVESLTLKLNESEELGSGGIFLSHHEVYSISGILNSAAYELNILADDF